MTDEGGREPGLQEARLAYVTSFGEGAVGFERRWRSEALASALVAERANELEEGLTAALDEAPSAFAFGSRYAVWSGYGPGVKRRLHVWPQGDAYGDECGARRHPAFTACGERISMYPGGQREWQRAALGEWSDQVELREAERAAGTDEERWEIERQRRYRHYGGELVDEDRICPRCWELTEHLRSLLRAETDSAPNGYVTRSVLPGDVALARADAIRVLAQELESAEMCSESQAAATSRAVEMGIALQLADELRRPAAIRAQFGDRGDRNVLRELALADPVRLAGALTREDWAAVIVANPISSDERARSEQRRARHDALTEHLVAALDARPRRRRPGRTR